MTIRIDGRQLNCRVRVSLQVGQVCSGITCMHTWVPALGKHVRGKHSGKGEGTSQVLTFPPTFAEPRTLSPGLLRQATPRASLLAPVVNLLAHSTVRFQRLLALLNQPPGLGMPVCSIEARRGVCGWKTAHETHIHLLLRCTAKISNPAPHHAHATLSSSAMQACNAPLAP